MSGGGAPAEATEEEANRFPLSSQLQREILREFPRFLVVAKTDTWQQAVIGQLLRVITVGVQSRYMSHYHTVMGYTLYVPTAWDCSSDVSRTILLRHERVHLRQRRRFGYPLFAFLYLVPIFPVGLAYGRARLEWEAYAETLRATAELCGIDQARSPALREQIVGRFTGGDYAWMWPFPGCVKGWFDKEIQELERTLH